MKSISGLLLFVATSNAITIQPRSPQEPPAPKAPKAPKAKGLGPFGIDLTFLQGFDGARLGPFLATLQPYFRPVAKSGVIPKFLNKYVPTLPLANRIALEPQVRASAKRTKSRLGPLTIVGKGQRKPSILSKGAFISLDPNGQSFISMYEGKSMCSDCTVLSARMGLEFEDGTVAGPEKGVYVHHLFAFDVSKAGVITSLPCDFATVNRSSTFDPMIPITPFAVQGEDNGDSAILFTANNGKFDSGFYIGANDTFLINSDLVNYNADAKKVYVTMDIEYVPGKVGLDAYSNLLSVVGCKLLEPKFSKTGPTETLSRKFPILIDGYILWTRGHLHNGGERMVMYLNDKEICLSRPTYEGERLTGMESCDTPIKVKRGDAITIKSVYDITKHPMRANSHGQGSSQDILNGHDLMGMFIISMAVDSDKKA